MSQVSEKQTAKTEQLVKAEQSANARFNIRQLGFELAFVGVVLLIFGVCFFAAYLDEYGTFEPTLEYGEKLYSRVVEYDYSKGESSYLESQIEAGLEVFDGYSYYYQAKIEYYYRLGYFHQTINLLNDIVDYANTISSKIYVYQKYIDCYEHFGNSDKVAEYQVLLDEVIAGEDS